MDTSLWAGLRQKALLVAVTALALLWPAFLNGGPFWFPDSSNYIRGADAVAVVVTDVRSTWSDKFFRTSPAQGLEDTSASFSADQEKAGQARAWDTSRPVLAGRSIYYGMTIYAPMRLFGPWGGIAAQALAVAALLVCCLSLLAQTLRTDERVAVPATLAVLVLLTPLPYYTSMLMPDVYSGVLILLLATLIALWDTMRRTQRVLLIAVCAVLTTFHTTQMLIAAGVAVAAAILLLRGKSRLRPFVIVAPAIVAALLGEMAFSHAVEAQLGKGPLSPPFLSARLTAAGPGADYLRRHCNGSDTDFALCAYRDRLPRNSDDFLWAQDEERGLFQLLDEETQRRIGSEDKRFFLAVSAADPLAAVTASAKAFGQQLAAFNLANFNYSEGFLADAPRQLPEAEERQFFASRAARGEMPVAFTVALTVASSGAALAILVYLVGGPLVRRNGPLPPAHRYALLIVFGILANAAICGAFSKPGARYQMRLIWLLPVAAAACAFGTRGSAGAAGAEKRQTPVGG